MFLSTFKKLPDWEGGTGAPPQVETWFPFTTKVICSVSSNSNLLILTGFFFLCE
jgi:hypothetical protein